MRPLPSPWSWIAPAILAVPALPASSSLWQGSAAGLHAVVAPQPEGPAERIDIPRPPAALTALPGVHVRPLVPTGTGGNPQPTDPPTVDVAPGALPASAPGDFQYFRNVVVNTHGAQNYIVAEPSVAQCADTTLLTGNFHASLSRDSGMSWERINPYTRFAALDDGFCCDQRVLYIPSHDITVWLLQYKYSASTQLGSYRIAVARGRDGLRNDVWTSYVFNGQNLGLGTRRWLDFPDIAYSRDCLWVSAWVLDDGPTNVDWVVWKLPLAQLAAGVNADVTYWHSAGSLGIGGVGHRLAQGAVHGTMYFTTLLSTTTIRLYSCDDPGNTLHWVDRPVAAWSNAMASAPGPDGRDWAGSAVGGVLTGYAKVGEAGFLWCCAPSAGRPMAYVRVARFRTSDLSLIAEHDIYGLSTAFAYPTAAANARGDVGCTVVVGGGAYYPHPSAFVIDAHDAWPPGATHAAALGNSGPSINRWGDYYTMQPHPLNPDTFVATGANQNGGPYSGAHNEVRYLWFGREEAGPTWLSLAVSSVPASGVPITVAEIDRDGLKDGATPFARTFANGQGYSVTAPRDFAAGGQDLVFDRWSVRTLGLGGFIDQPVDQRTFTTSSIGTSDDQASARYLVRRTLAVTSTPAPGAAIAVSLRDVYGDREGSTDFVRYYKSGAAVTLTAPAALAAGVPFRRWRIGAVAQPAGQQTVALTMDADVAAVAEYQQHTPGSFTPIGTGCVGSSGVLTQVPGITTPEIHTIVAYGVQAGPTSGLAVLVLGLDTTQWSGVPLPLALGAAAPGCAIYQDLAFTVVMSTNAAGAGVALVQIPDDPLLIGGHFYTQIWGIDPMANALGISFSQEIDTRIGGSW